MSDNTAIAGGDIIRDLARQSGAVKTQVFQLDLGGPSANAENLITGAVPVTKPVGAASIFASQATIGLSAAQIVAARTGAVGTGRCSVTLKHTGTETVFIGPAGVTTSTGYPVLPGEIYHSDTTAAIFGISTIAGNVIGVFETF